MKNRIISLLIVILILISLVACGNSNSTPHSDSTDAETSSSTASSVSSVSENEDNQEAGALASGNYTLPCGMELQFFDNVRNDVTGNWRRSATASSLSPADYALEYYEAMFSSDDETHSVWNATLGTNTQISVAFGILYVDTYEYVSGEEHDAKIMFSGEKLNSRMIDIATGEEIEQ